jgi:hypothetical protein
MSPKVERALDEILKLARRACLEEISAEAQFPDVVAVMRNLKLTPEERIELVEDLRIAEQWLRDDNHEE